MHRSKSRAARAERLIQELNVLLEGDLRKVALVLVRVEEYCIDEIPDYCDPGYTGPDFGEMVERVLNRLEN